MSFDKPDYSTFFEDLLNIADVQSSEKELFSDPITEEKPQRPTRRASAKPKSPSTRKTSKGKENVAPKPPAPKKTTKKQPLKVIAPPKSPNRRPKAAAPLKSPNKKACPSPAKGPNRKACPSPAKGPNRRTKPPAAPPSPGRQKAPVPKIIVYEDPEGKRPRRGGGVRASKSLEGRKSLPEGESPGGGPRRARHSFNDLPSLRSPAKRGSGGGRARQREPEFAEMVGRLELMFPGVDPEYLKNQLVRVKGCLAEAIEAVLGKERTGELPTRADYLRRRETEELERRYLEGFTVEGFLREIPDPWEHFLRAERGSCVLYSGHSLHYLKNKFRKHYLQAIEDALVRNEHSLYLANKELSKKSRLLKMRATNRSKAECEMGRPLEFDGRFIQEVAFVENEAKIKSQVRKAEAARQKRLERAEREGALLECGSCVAPTLEEEGVRCPNGHVFCRGCVVRYVEGEMEKEVFRFRCLLKCEEELEMESLQGALPAGMRARIADKEREDVKGGVWGAVEGVGAEVGDDSHTGGVGFIK